MSGLTPAFGCGSLRFDVGALAAVQFAGAVLIPVAAVLIIGVVSRRHPTQSLRWTSRRISHLLGRRAVVYPAVALLAVGLLAFGTSIFLSPEGGPECAKRVGMLSSVGLLITLGGAMLAGVAWAVIKQAGWVVLATFLALDIWIVWGMVMMHLEGSPDAPDSMLLLAFVMHAVCMYLTTVWAFHARNLSTMAQIRAGEAGRSIGAVWVFLAAYIVVGLLHNDAGPFDSAAGGAVLSALTLSALALTMGSGYTKYREVMAEETSALPEPV